MTMNHADPTDADLAAACRAAAKAFAAILDDARSAGLEVSAEIAIPDEETKATKVQVWLARNL